MTARRIRSSTNLEQAARDCDALDRALETLIASGADPVVAPLADLSRPAQVHLAHRWPTLPDDLRARIVATMVADAEMEVARNFDRVFSIAIDDMRSDVRAQAWEGLWENDSLDVLHLLLARLDAEMDSAVRAAMADTLGRFAALAEMGQLTENHAAAVRGALLGLARRDPDQMVRDRALEAAGYFAGDGEVIAEIERRYNDGSDAGRIQALRAMGRQADRRFRAEIMENLSDPEPEVRFAAVHAAGDSGDQAYVPALIDLLDDEDREVQLAVISALGAIGGTLAVRTLRRLLQDDEPAIAEAAQDALDEALISAGELPSGPAITGDDLDDLA